MYLVSACLAGMNCRYDGSSKENDFVMKLVNEGRAFPICPEQLGGLTTPRTPCELNCQGKIVNKEGEDKTQQFLAGAERTLAVAKALGVTKAIFKANSPSCGCGEIYDGSFSGKLIPGNGVVADLLIKNGIQVLTEKELANISREKEL
jgi:uncharacterized protein YbbK (DUF523 family)